MNTVAEVLLAVLLVSVATLGSASMAMRSRVHRSLRLVPGRRVDVPWYWRWSPRAAPVLHRRLQRSCQLVMAATGRAVGDAPRARRDRRRARRDQDTSILQATGRTLIEQAAGIDMRLTAADRGGPGWRRLHLPALRSEVAALEASCLRLAQLSRAFDEHVGTAAGHPGSQPPRAELLMDAMEEAMGELRRDPQAAEQ